MAEDLISDINPSAKPSNIKFRKMLPLFGTVFLIFVLVAVSIFVRYPQIFHSKAALAGPNLSIVPSTKTSTVGETYSLGIVLNTDIDTVSAVDLRLSYDPAAIEVQSFTPGTALPVVLSPVSTGSGNLAVTLGVNPTTPFKGSTVLGNLNIKALTSATSTISFAGTTMVASISKTTNSLASTTGAQINPPVITPTATPTPTPTSSLPASTVVYKLINNTTQAIFLTANESEKNTLVAAGWVLGVSPFRVWAGQSSPSLKPAYRLRVGTFGYLFTTSAQERDDGVRGGYIYEGIAFYVYDFPQTGTVPIYRLSKTQFLYTASTQERDSLVTSGYHLDGTAFYAVSP